MEQKLIKYNIDIVIISNTTDRNRENLKNIKNPTLIIWGDQDKAYNFNQVDTLNKNIPNSELKIIEGCSHNVHLEKPDEFNEVVKYFLAEAFKI